MNANFNPWHSVQTSDGCVVLVLDTQRFAFPAAVANALSGELIAASVHLAQQGQGYGQQLGGRN